MNLYFICGRVSLSCRLLIFIKRIVGVAVGIEGVESCTIVRVEGQPKFDAPRQVWVGNEMTSERNQVSISLLDDSLCAIRFKATCGDDFAFENCPHVSGRYWGQTVLDGYVPFDTGFNDVEICKAEPVQLFRHVTEQCAGVTIRHRVPGPGGTNSHSNSISTPHRY